jgi:hypothetical protein
MIGVLALAQGFGPESVARYWPYAAVFFGGIVLLALALVYGRRLFGGAPSHGYVLDINAVRTPASERAVPPQHKRAA